MVLNITCLGISTGWDEIKFKDTNDTFVQRNTFTQHVCKSLQNLTSESVLRLTDEKNMLQTKKDILETNSMVIQINISYIFKFESDESLFLLYFSAILNRHTVPYQLFLCNLHVPPLLSELCLIW